MLWEGMIILTEEMRVNDAGVEEFITLAAEYGFALTKEDIVPAPCAIPARGAALNQRFNEVGDMLTTCWDILSPS